MSEMWFTILAAFHLPSFNPFMTGTYFEIYANNADPVQTPHAASDQGLHFFAHRSAYVKYKRKKKEKKSTLNHNTRNVQFQMIRMGMCTSQYMLSASEHGTRLKTALHFLQLCHKCRLIWV